MKMNQFIYDEIESKSAGKRSFIIMYPTSIYINLDYADRAGPWGAKVPSIIIDAKGFYYPY